MFSRLWPTDTRSEDAPLWKLALQLGAQCTTALDDAVTHVVTNTRYTEKVLPGPHSSPLTTRRIAEAQIDCLVCRLKRRCSRGSMSCPNTGRLLRPTL